MYNSNCMSLTPLHHRTVRRRLHSRCRHHTTRREALPGIPRGLLRMSPSVPCRFASSPGTLADRLGMVVPRLARPTAACLLSLRRRPSPTPSVLPSSSPSLAVVLFPHWRAGATTPPRSWHRFIPRVVQTECVTDQQVMRLDPILL